VQVLGAAWSTIAFLAAALAASRRGIEGLALPLWLALYCTGSFLLGFARADEVPFLAGWRANQATDLALVVVGTSTLAIRRSQTRRSLADRRQD
jgi:prolipoprotein diacylglyceryltransferase